MKYAVLLLALIFVGCSGGSTTEKSSSSEKVSSADGDSTTIVDGYESITIDGKTIQIDKEDFPSAMNWDDAKKACENLGNGWRLPDIDELTAMDEQLHQKGKGKFKIDGVYWSSSVYNADDICIYMLSNGPYNSNRYGTEQVRAVRTMP